MSRAAKITLENSLNSSSSSRAWMLGDSDAKNELFLFLSYGLFSLEQWRPKPIPNVIVFFKDLFI